MQHVRDTLNEENPEEDIDLIMEELDEMADMQPGNEQWLLKYWHLQKHATAFTI